MIRDYNWEYIRLTDSIIDRFVSNMEERHPGAFFIDEIDVRKSVINLLSVILMNNSRRDAYNIRRVSGESRRKLGREIARSIYERYNRQDCSLDFSFHADRLDEQMANVEKGNMLFYCINERQLKYIYPIIDYISKPVTILCTFKVGKEIVLRENIRVIEWLNYSSVVSSKNRYLNSNFPTIVNDFNHFCQILQEISPSIVTILEGCHDDMETLSSACRLRGIKTVCLQQGWPTLMTCRSINMGFDYFLTWGDKFSRIVEKYNEGTKVISAGYPYQVKKKKEHCITFFLQPNSMIVTKRYLRLLLKLSAFCAMEFPNMGVIIREHPQSKLSVYYRQKLSQYPNTTVIDSIDISEVFSFTLLSVSIYSSTLVESIVHGSIPFIFNPTSSRLYYPDLERDGIAYSARSLEEAKMKLKDLLSNREELQAVINTIDLKRHTFFSRIGLESIEFITGRIVEFSRS